MKILSGSFAGSGREGKKPRRVVNNLVVTDGPGGKLFCFHSFFTVIFFHKNTVRKKVKENNLRLSKDAEIRALT